VPIDLKMKPVSLLPFAGREQSIVSLQQPVIPYFVKKGHPEMYLAAV
jgi:hypothetical protein